MVKCQTVEHFKFCHGHVLHLVHHVDDALLEQTIIQLLVYLPSANIFSLSDRKHIHFIQELNFHRVFIGNFVHHAHQLDGRYFHLVASFDERNVIGTVDFFAGGLHRLKVHIDQFSVKITKFLTRSQLFFVGSEKGKLENFVRKGQNANNLLF